MFEKFCCQCGNKYPKNYNYGDICQCGFILYQNPIPVGVAIIEIKNYGLLGVNRIINPKGLALVGGFLETNSNWQEEVFREVREETSLEYNNKQLEIFDMISVPDNSKILIFTKLPNITIQTFKNLKVNDNENQSLEIINKNNYDQIVFDIHKEIVKKYLKLN